jgi:hypothetical protein
LDITQLLANAFAGAFGMGMANEIYHAFVEYRKILKQRLLDDTIVAIHNYRMIKAQERAMSVIRHGKSPIDKMGLKVTASPTPIVLTPVRKAHILRPHELRPVVRMPISSERMSQPVVLEPMSKETHSDWFVRRDSVQRPPTDTDIGPITYKIPEKRPNHSLDGLTGRLMDWENS